MEVYEKLVKPVHEVRYLAAENVERYRVIVRYFFEEYESIKYWLYMEDVFTMMVTTGRFPDYTRVLCQSDLEALCQWGNLTAMQDTSKAKTLEEYRNKRYRYQLSEYTVEIERMTLRLENLEIEGASLEPSLLERMHSELLKFPAILKKSEQEVNSWWRGVDNDFIRLNQNYQDYVRTLNSHKAEEMMMSEQFLFFKEQLLEYLHTFVKRLHEYGGMIARHLEASKNDDQMRQLVEMIALAELMTPRLDREVDADSLRLNVSRRWVNLNNWFNGKGDANELERMYDITNDIIRKITSYAQQIGSLRFRNVNRKEEYRHIANVFGKCENLNEAHKLSANVFGVASPFHLINLEPRKTDSIDSGVYDEKPTQIHLESRSQVARSKTIRTKIEDVSAYQRLERMKIEQKRERDLAILQSYIIDGRIDFATLPVIDDYTRQVMLSWVSKANNQSDRRSKTDFGRSYRVELPKNNEMCVVKCDDGNFTMPSMSIIFED